MPVPVKAAIAAAVPVIDAVTMPVVPASMLFRSATLGAPDTVAAKLAALVIPAAATTVAIFAAVPVIVVTALALTAVVVAASRVIRSVAATVVSVTVTAIAPVI